MLELIIFEFIVAWTDYVILYFDIGLLWYILFGCWGSKVYVISKINLPPGYDNSKLTLETGCAVFTGLVWAYAVHLLIDVWCVCFSFEKRLEHSWSVSALQ